MRVTLAPRDRLRAKMFRQERGMRSEAAALAFLINAGLKSKGF